MQMINLFTYPLLAVGSEFIIYDLNTRAEDAVFELKQLIPELDGGDFEILYKYVMGDKYLSLAVSASISNQLRLELDASNQSLLKYRLEIIAKVKELPILLNNIVLTELADELFEGKKVAGKQFEFDAIKRLIKKKQGESVLIGFDGGDQILLFPTSLEYKLDPTVRKIRCKVDSLRKFYANINCVKDERAKKPTPGSRCFKLNLKNCMGDSSAHEQLSKVIFQSCTLTIDVQAILDGATGAVREYLLIDMPFFCLNE